MAAISPQPSSSNAMGRGSLRRLSTTGNEPVLSVTTQVDPIRGFDPMIEAQAKLKQSQCTAAPVVDEIGHCTGILTLTDIERFQEIKDRYKSGDLSALDSVFEIDQYGMRRLCFDSFEQVQRHMTSPVITIREDQTAAEADELLRQHSGIHHLVVVDSGNHPLGIVEAVFDAGHEFEFHN